MRNDGTTPADSLLQRLYTSGKIATAYQCFIEKKEEHTRIYLRCADTAGNEKEQSMMVCG